MKNLFSVKDLISPPLVLVTSLSLKLTLSHSLDSYTLNVFLQSDLQFCLMKIRLSEILLTDANLRVPTPFQKKSSFLPSSNLNPTIVTHSRAVEHELAKMCQNVSPLKSNLSKAELKALNDLEKRNEIVVKPADKGGSVVIMNFQQYDTNIKSQLSDANCYSLLNSDPTDTIKNEIDDFIDTAFRGSITEQEKDFLITKSPICPVFYG